MRINCRISPTLVFDVQADVEGLSLRSVRSPCLAQGSGAEVIASPAVGVKDDEPREMHELLLAKDVGRVTPVAQPL